jgi:hypothetical protein
MNAIKKDTGSQASMMGPIIDQQKENTKETIRRLRIQNKKLLEQVALFKNKLAHEKHNKAQLLSRMKDLRKLNKSLTDTLGKAGINRGKD